MTFVPDMESELIKIIREFVDTGPIYDDESGHHCLYCLADENDHQELGPHESRCLWQRAKELLESVS